MTTPHRRRPLRVTLGIALVVLLLVACSAENIAEKASERALQDSGVEGAEIDIDGEDGSIKIEGEDGGFNLTTGGELPDGFPEGIPLVDGEVLSGQSSMMDGQESYMVRIAVADPRALETLESELADAGFIISGDDFTSQSQAGSMWGATFKRANTTLNVAVMGDRSKKDVTYTVSIK